MRINICKNNVDYISIRKAMIAGARTADEVAKLAKSADAKDARENLGWILSSVCG